VEQGVQLEEGSGGPPDCENAAGCAACLRLGGIGGTVSGCRYARVCHGGRNWREGLRAKGVGRGGGGGREAMNSRVRGARDGLQQQETGWQKLFFGRTGSTGTLETPVHARQNPRLRPSSSAPMAARIARLRPLLDPTRKQGPPRRRTSQHAAHTYTLHSAHAPPASPEYPAVGKAVTTCPWQAETSCRPENPQASNKQSQGRAPACAPAAPAAPGGHAARRYRSPKSTGRGKGWEGTEHARGTTWSRVGDGVRHHHPTRTRSRHPHLLKERLHLS